MIEEKNFHENGWRSRYKRMRDEKLNGAPDWLMWTMTFINRIGFPIAVAIYLGYMQLNALPKIVEALNNVNATMVKVEVAIKDNTDVMKSWRYGSRRYIPD